MKKFKLILKTTNLIDDFIYTIIMESENKFIGEINFSSKDLSTQISYMDTENVFHTEHFGEKGYEMEHKINDIDEGLRELINFSTYYKVPKKIIPILKHVYDLFFSTSYMNYHIEDIVSKFLLRKEKDIHETIYFDKTDKINLFMFHNEKHVQKVTLFDNEQKELIKLEKNLENCLMSTVYPLINELNEPQNRIHLYAYLIKFIDSDQKKKIPNILKNVLNNI